MLKELFIKNFALIQKSQLYFESGLSVITGETGAGKSIMLNALGLILGNRADLTTIGDRDHKCVVEATFELSDRFETFFKTEDLDFEAQTIIRRELAPNGKSRAFINDTPVTNKTLRDLTSQLIDIHGQQDNRLLLDAHFRLQVLDRIAATEEFLVAYRSGYRQYQNLQSKLAELKESLGKNKQELDFKSFLLDELTQANLEDPNELASLEERQQLFEKQEDITRLCQEITALNDDPTNLSGTINAISKKAVTLGVVSEPLRKMANAANEAFSALQEMEALAEQTLENSSFDEADFQKNTERIDVLNSLLVKHNAASTEDLIAIRDQLESEVGNIIHSDDHIADLMQQIKEQEEKLKDQAKGISQRRKKTAALLGKQMQQYLPQLNMADAELLFRHTELTELGSTGLDAFELETCLNKGGVWAPVQKTASGGELARIMLAFKTTISAHTAMPTLIFDEIDTGLGGETASKMGGMLQEIAERGQVISITHLAQIAGKGAHHFKVSKQSSVAGTTTQITPLKTEERLQEIARMISGEQISPEALANAKVLLS